MEPASLGTVQYENILSKNVQNKINKFSPNANCLVGIYNGGKPFCDKGVRWYLFTYQRGGSS